MTNLDLFNLEENLSPEEYVETVAYIAESYGLYGYITEYRANEDHEDSGMYILVGNDPSIVSRDPVGLINREQRSPSLFYPDAWACRIDGANQLEVLENMLWYCKNAEAINTLYRSHDVKVPVRLGIEEMGAIAEANAYIIRPDFDEDAKQIYRKRLDKYFENEKHSGPISSAWRNFVRSERYNTEKSKLSNIIRFIFNNNQKVSLKHLASDRTKLIVEDIQEHEYKELRKRLKDYPDIIYNVSGKDVIDHGQINGGKDPWADEINHFEFRTLTFRSCDEPIIAEMLNSIRLSYAEQTLTQDNDVMCLSVPVNDFLNFSLLAKSNNIQYRIDNESQFGNHRLNEVPVVVKKDDEVMVKRIFKRIVVDKWQGYHCIDDNDRISLQHALERAKEKQLEANGSRLDKSKSKEEPER